MKRFKDALRRADELQFPVGAARSTFAVVERRRRRLKPLTRDIGQFVADSRIAALPDEAIANAELGFTDCVAVMLAGNNEPAVDKLRQLLGVAPPTPFGSPELAARDRALLAGAAAHVLDYDDVALDGHTSAVLVPAILSVCLDRRMAGADAVLAYAVGFEVWAELIRRDVDAHHNKGWHPTTVFGSVASAAACASLLRLSVEESANAVAIAASMAAGLAANFGSMTKSLQVGRAAEAGVTAALLAANGFTGASDVIEHPRGYLQAISPNGHVQLDQAPALGRIWRLATIGLNIKKYPVCYCAHRPIDAILDLLAEHPVPPDEVAQIDVHLGRTASNILRETLAANALQAKFSLEFAMASALVAGTVGLNQLQDGFVEDAAVQTAMTRVGRHLLDDEATSDLPLAKSDWVCVTTCAGQRLESRKVAHARGAPALPLGRTELWRKFEECTAPSLGSESRRLFDNLIELRSASSMSTLAEMTFFSGERVT